MKYFFDTEFHEYSKQPKALGINVGKPINTIELISIGIVSEGYTEGQCNYTKDTNGHNIPALKSRKYYAVCNEFDLKAAWENEWLRENVLTIIWDELHHKIHHWETTEWSYKGLKRLLKWKGKSRKQIAGEILLFTGGSDSNSIYKNKPEFYAYYADYDWVLFCWLFGRMIELPPHFPMYCRDLKQSIDEICEKDNLNWLWWVKLNEAGKASPEEILKAIKALPYYPVQTNEHNALDDAEWNYELYLFLKTL